MKHFKCLATFVAAILCFLLAPAPRAGAVTLNPTVTTSRGCLETGDNPVFQVGELVTISFRVDSPDAASAVVTLFDRLANGAVGAIAFGQIATNQTRSFNARIAPPLGTEKLILQAERGGTKAQNACSFIVASGPPSPGTPTATRTPTPITSPTSTRTPGGDLSGSIRTNRGCIETGDNPVYAVGDPIAVSFRVNSASLPAANTSILDFVGNILVRVFSFGTIQTNANFLLTGFVGSPPGPRTLRLRAQAAGLDVFADCSFTVVSGPPQSPTATKTPKPTRTPTLTRTPTVTRTPGGPCAGACTQPGVVTVGDLVTVTQIAAGVLPVSACPSADANHNGMVSLDEVLLAVNNAIHGCNAG